MKCTIASKMDISKYTSQDKILVAVDCILFGFDEKKMKALLIKRDFEPEKGKWSLMGGFVNKNENVDAAASRVLKELTGLTDIYMEQLFCFGNTKRDEAGRVISISYFALIKIAEYGEQLTSNHEAKWFPIDTLPSLIFDHRLMVKKARERLQEKVSRHPIGFELLPNKFTLPQLQNLYEDIFGTSFDKRNFTRKILSLKVLKKLSQKEKTSSRKGAFYYVFDKKKYKNINQDLKFI